MRTKLIDNTRGQWRLWAYHRQIYFFLLRPFAQCLHVGDGHIEQIGIARRTAIAWGHIHFLNAFRLRQLPSQRMLTSATTYYQYFHRSSLIQKWMRCGKRFAHRPNLPRYPRVFAFWQHHRLKAQCCSLRAW